MPVKCTEECSFHLLCDFVTLGSTLVGLGYRLLAKDILASSETKPFLKYTPCHINGHRIYGQIGYMVKTHSSNLSDIWSFWLFIKYYVDKTVDQIYHIRLGM